LKFGAKEIDAVEIDPVIQNIGRRYHPDRPYQDSRVIPHLDDGRHFLRTTEKKYDLVVYALVDSLLLHSSYANIRLESYLFTEEAFADARRVLKPDGIFVMYNYFRQGWIVERIAAMTETIFGCRPPSSTCRTRRISRLGPARLHDDYCGL
jgi:spermidine synthase